MKCQKYGCTIATKQGIVWKYIYLHKASTHHVEFGSTEAGKYGPVGVLKCISNRKWRRSRQHTPLPSTCKGVFNVRRLHYRCTFLMVWVVTSCYGSISFEQANPAELSFLGNFALVASFLSYFFSMSSSNILASAISRTTGSYLS